MVHSLISPVEGRLCIYAERAGGRRVLHTLHITVCSGIQFSKIDWIQSEIDRYLQKISFYFLLNV
jgi:hypothetical protein